MKDQIKYLIMYEIIQNDALWTRKNTSFNNYRDKLINSDTFNELSNFYDAGLHGSMERLIRVSFNSYQSLLETKILLNRLYFIYKIGIN